MGQCWAIIMLSGRRLPLSHRLMVDRVTNICSASCVCEIPLSVLSLFNTFANRVVMLYHFLILHFLHDIPANALTQ